MRTLRQGLEELAETLPERQMGKNAGKDVGKLAVRQGFEPWIQLLGRITV
jgi:hypothetical protein